MCAPVLIPIALSAMGTYGQVQSLRAQQQAARYNASIARQQAADAFARGAVAEQRHRMSVSQLIAQQRTAAAASGVIADVGSPAGLVEDSAMLGELDALTIRHNTAVEAWGYNARAKSLNYQAKAAGAAATTAVVSGAVNAGRSALLAYRQGA